MLTIDELFSKKNRKNTLNSLSNKVNTRNSDSLSLSELESYLTLNEETIIKKIKNKEYKPGVVKIIDIVKSNGGKRNIANYESLDRYLCKLLANKLKKYIEPIFLSNSYAYQENKGVLKAVEQAKKYIEDDNVYIIKMDIDNFFGSINHAHIMNMLKNYIEDEAILYLINQYLKCQIEYYGEYKQNDKGLIQGNPISPILSNLYAHNLDCYMEEKGYKWIRFSDDIA